MAREKSFVNGAQSLLGHAQRHGVGVSPRVEVCAPNMGP